MSDVEVVRAAFSGWDRPSGLDVESLTEDERRATVAQLIDRAFDAGFHPEVEYREDPDFPGAGSYRGLEEVKACFKEYAEVLRFDDSQVEAVVDGGEQVAAIVHIAARPAGSSEPVVHRWAYVCRVRESKIAFFQAYLDPRKAFEAAGIDEPAS
jgi:ketosteroid isomerase-like protein